jgi:hypothetical protein
MAAIGVASLAFDRSDAQASVNHGGQMADRFCFYPIRLLFLNDNSECVSRRRAPARELHCVWHGTVSRWMHGASG